MRTVASNFVDRAWVVEFWSNETQEWYPEAITEGRSNARKQAFHLRSWSGMKTRVRQYRLVPVK